MSDLFTVRGEEDIETGSCNGLDLHHEGILAGLLGGSLLLRFFLLHLLLLQHNMDINKCALRKEQDIVTEDTMHTKHDKNA
jgi:hypothetical protein